MTLAARLAASPGWAMAQQGARNINALRQGTPMGQTAAQAYQQSIMNRAKMRQQEMLAQEYARKANPFYELDTAIERGYVPQGTTPMQWEAMKRGTTPQKRETAKDVSGLLRYMDTGQRVFPDVEAPPEDREMKQVGDEWRYVDTGELVFPDAPAVAPENFEDVAKLRKEFRDETSVFQDQQRAFGRVLASAREPSAAGDMALVFNFMKVLDPGSTVREGEYASAANAAGVPERVRTLWNKLVDGEILGPEQRKDFVKRSAKLYEEAAEGFKSSVDEYRSLSEGYGFDPNRVILRDVRYGPETYQEFMVDPLEGTGIQEVKQDAGI